MAGLGNVAALILAIAILQLAQGLLSVFFPLAMSADGMPPAVVGLVGAAYSAGFMAGAWVGPTLLARSGHIRVFAACGAIAAAATLSVHFAGGAIGWMCARAAMGASVALLFAAAESWMNASLGRGERGQVIGIYMVTTKAALALGPFLTYGFSATAPEPLMVAAAIIALAIVPICFTTTKQPEPPKAQPLALREQFATAPAAVTACFGAGVLNAAVLTLSPLYAKDHFGEASATTFQAAAQFGSLLLQYPAGRLSDRIDRRLVIAGLSAIAAVAAAFLTIFGGELSFPIATLLFAIWGAGSLSFYGIAVAHMADRAGGDEPVRPERVVRLRLRPGRRPVRLHGDPQRPASPEPAPHARSQGADAGDQRRRRRNGLWRGRRSQALIVSPSAGSIFQPRQCARIAPHAGRTRRTGGPIRCST
ncbi:MAG: MFS transporter [Alphaproteobacteria bacterium]|nr:MFS transporter [Alphaproteobacteria bacterium]